MRYLTNLGAVDTGAVAERLLSQGIVSAVFLEGDDLIIESDADSAAIDAALSGWQAPAASENPALPDGVRIHLQHLRDYLAASPTQITNAQTVHVVQDLIRAVHYLNARLANDG